MLCVGRIKRDAGVTDFFLRAHEALCHRWYRNEKRASNFFRREPAKRAQRQSDACFFVQAGMGARKDQSKPIVGNDRIFIVFVIFGNSRLEPSDEFVLLRPERIAAQRIDSTIASCRDDPCRGVRRGASPRPTFERGEIGRLYCILGEIDVAEGAR